MAKVLITSIGKPREEPKRDKNGNIEEDQHQYRSAKYAINWPGGAEGIYKSSYIFEALTQLEHIDRLILIGTAGSGWMGLYEYMATPKFQMSMTAPGVVLDEEYRKKLEPFDNKVGNIDRPLSEVYALLGPLKECFDPKYHVEILLMKYGMEDADWDANLQVLSRIADLLEDGDEVYLDVTHSFRSLPIFQMLAVSYLTNISKRKITIKRITYGIWEVHDEFDGDTPIIDLSRLNDLMEYVKLAGEYQRFGTAYGLQDMIKKGRNIEGFTEQQVALLADLGDMVNINNMEGFRALVENAEEMQKKASGDASEFTLLVKTICEELVQNFGAGISDPIMTELNLACWHMDKKHYFNAVTTARETCISFTMQLCGGTGDDYEDRKPFDDLTRALYQKTSARKKLDKPSQRFVRLDARLHFLRNAMAHPSPKMARDKKGAIIAALVSDRVLEENKIAEADDALKKYFGIADAEERERLIALLHTEKETVKDILVEKLQDPYPAEVEASGILVRQIRDVYRTYFFVSPDNAAENEGRRAALGVQLLAIKEKSDEKKRKKAEKQSG